MLGSELNLPDMCQGLVNRVPITPAVSALAAVEVMANGVLVTPEKNRKGTSHLKYWTLFPVGDLTAQSIPTRENKESRDFCPEFIKTLL